MIDIQSAEQFKTLEQETGLKIVEFYSPSCSTCHYVSQLLQDNEPIGYKFIKVDASVHKTLAREYSIMSAPSVYLLFTQKNLKLRLFIHFDGANTVDKIKELKQTCENLHQNLLEQNI